MAESTTISLIKENLIPVISLLVVMIPLTLYLRAETKTEIKEFKAEMREQAAESNKKWEESNKRWEDYRKESDAKWLAANKRSDELYKALIKERK